MSRRVLTSLLCLLLGLTACSFARPSGPPFTALTPPVDLQTLVYIHRFDALRGVGAADIRLDGESFGKLLDREYLGLLLAPGSHRLKLRLRWAGLIPRSWNALEFETKPGQTLHLRVRAGYEEGAAVPSAAAVPGRADRQANVAIFVSRIGSAQAMAQLAECQRGPGR